MTTTARSRVHSVDLARGFACLSMPMYHGVFGLYTFGFVETKITNALFWQVYQLLGMSAFIAVSGIAFVISTEHGLRWSRLLRRAGKLALVAAGISLVTYFVLPDRFVRFGIIHFFTLAILLAPLLARFGNWTLLPGLMLAVAGFAVPKSGMYPEGLLYITGLMSERPASIDYVPLLPWFGVFVCGMGAAKLIAFKRSAAKPKGWKRSVIWLGQHSLEFYVVHQVVVFAVLQVMALVLL